MRLLANVGAVVLVASVSSCQLLDKEIPVFDEQTGEQVGTTTVGDVLADSGEAASDMAGGLLGALTGNPILGGGAAALGAGLFQAARRKKKQPSVEQEAQVS